MTVKERLEDISKRSGLSEDIVRRVLNAEKESAKSSLRKGERATLIGRCTIMPNLKHRLQVGGELVGSIKLSASAKALEEDLKDLTGFEKSEIDNEIPEGVRIMQIPSLT